VRRNIDVTLLSRIIERGMAADGRLCRVIAAISDRPGSLARLATVLASTGAASRTSSTTATSARATSAP
jgi:threonine dehydratase